MAFNLATDLSGKERETGWQEGDREIDGGERR